MPALLVHFFHQRPLLVPELTLDPGKLRTLLIRELEGAVVPHHARPHAIAAVPIPRARAVTSHHPRPHAMAARSVVTPHHPGVHAVTAVPVTRVVTLHHPRAHAIDRKSVV